MNICLPITYKGVQGTHRCREKGGASRCKRTEQNLVYHLFKMPVFIVSLCKVARFAVQRGALIGRKVKKMSPRRGVKNHYKEYAGNCGQKDEKSSRLYRRVGFAEFFSRFCKVSVNMFH